MSEISIKYVEGCFLDIKVLMADNMGKVMITREEGSERFCQLLLDLAIDLKEYLTVFERKIKEGKQEAEEIDRLKDFLEKLLEFFTETHFSHGKRVQSWIDMVFLFFGIAVYYKASMRVSQNTIELFFLSEVFEKLEKVIYNNMYYQLTDFKY